MNNLLEFSSPKYDSDAEDAERMKAVRAASRERFLNAFRPWVAVELEKNPGFALRIEDIERFFNEHKEVFPQPKMSMTALLKLLTPNQLRVELGLPELGSLARNPRNLTEDESDRAAN